jgi:hypothetical protein
MEKFPITIKAGSQTFHLVCELVNRDKDFETFKVYPEKKPDKHVLSSEQPATPAQERIEA